MAAKVIPWVSTTGTAIVGLCEVAKENLGKRFEKISANESGTEITDISLTNAQGLIRDLHSNADIILGNAYANSGQTPPPSTSPSIS